MTLDFGYGPILSFLGVVCFVWLSFVWVSFQGALATYAALDALKAYTATDFAELGGTRGLVALAGTVCPATAAGADGRFALEGPAGERALLSEGEKTEAGQSWGQTGRILGREAALHDAARLAMGPRLVFGLAEPFPQQGPYQSTAFATLVRVHLVLPPEALPEARRTAAAGFAWGVLSLSGLIAALCLLWLP